MAVLLIVLLLISNVFANQLIIATSANAQFAVKEIIKVFKENYPDTNIKLVISSSGKLTNQILRGAPFDIFLSADDTYPKILYEKGLTLNKPKAYAYGVIVIWSLKKIKIDKNLNILLSEKVKKIAVANPKVAPYGKASLEVLKNLKLYKKIKHKLIFGESISQASQYIYKKLVDIGFTSKSIVLSPNTKNKGVWKQIDPALYKPIKQSAVILKNAKGKKFAYTFFKFLFSKKAKEILKKYGYKVDKI